MLVYALRIVILAMLSGFSALAATYTARLGDFGLTTVSELTKFYAGDGNLWRSAAVTVTNPATGLAYRKTPRQMRHLPVETLVTIEVPTKQAALDSPRTISHICLQVNLWRCEERLRVFNRGASDTVTSLTVPTFFPVILNLPATGPAPNPNQPNIGPVLDRIQLLQTQLDRLFWIIVADSLLILTLLLLFIIFRTARQPETVPPVPHSYRTGERRRIIRAPFLRNLRRWGDRVRTTFRRETVVTEQPGERTVERTTEVKEETAAEPPPVPPSHLNADLHPPPPEDRDSETKLRSVLQSRSPAEKLDSLRGDLANKRIPAEIEDHWPEVVIRVPDDIALVERTWEALRNFSNIFTGIHDEPRRVKRSDDDPTYTYVFTIRERT